MGFVPRYAVPISVMKSSIFRSNFVGAVFGCAMMLMPFLTRAEDSDEQKAPATSTVEIPATAGHRNPVKIGKVTKGQTVTLTIGHVLWTGGGSKRGAFADWHGYRDRREHNGLPWMAVVLAVGDHNFLPDKKEFTFTVPADGELVIFANDENPNGNSGKGEVTVKVE